MKITFQQRINLNNQLPQRGDVETMRLRNALEVKLNYNDKEEQVHQIKYLNDGRMVFQNAEKVYDIELNKNESKYLLDFFNELQENKSFPFWAVTIYDQLNK